ncbi:MAG: hypothetical protein AAF631_00285 [Pseudomonadota bacterium]
MRIQVISFLAAGVFAGLSTGAAMAQSINTQEFSTIDDAITALGPTLYTELDPNYTTTSVTNFNFDAGSRQFTLGYGTSESGDIVVIENDQEIAAFSGATRAEAEALLMQFLSDEFRQDTEALNRVVANTPNDPVAGTPASLQARMAEATFQNGSDVGPSPRTGGSRGRGTLANPNLGLSLQSGRYTGPGFSATINTIPLSYSIPLNDPRWAVKIDAPISFTTINGVDNVSGSVGVGLRIPVYDNWTLTPEFRVGLTRNRTAGVTAKLAALSLTSNYRVDLGQGYGLTIGNSLTYSRTFGSAYDQSNVYNKNGVEISGPFEPKLYGLPTNWQFSVVHTKVGGDPTFIDEWVDVSLSVGTVGSKRNVTWDSVRLGITYTRANRGIEGINFNFGYEF